jgi:hypothetical protein
MNHIQELIDENKDKLPVGLAKTLLEACKKESDDNKLYTVTLTKVVAFPYLTRDDCSDEANVNLTNETLKLIVEPDESDDDDTSFRVTPDNLLKNGKVPSACLTHKMPFVYRGGGDELLILHSIVPYIRKRQRGSADL